MKKLFYHFLISVILILIISSCSQSRHITVPSTIPAEMQQLVKSTKVDDIAYSFISDPDAEVCKYEFTYGGLTVHNEVNINSSLRSLMDELIQTKFSNINSKSANRINVKITNVSSDVNNNSTLQLGVVAEITLDGLSNSKEFSYSMRYPYTSSEQSNAIHAFLMKFVIGVDKFIDNEFDVQ